MGNLKKRIERLEKKFGAGKDDVPEELTLAWILKWTTLRKNANGGTLSPEDSAKSREYMRRFMAEWKK